MPRLSATASTRVLDLVVGHVPQFERECHVVENVHVRVEGIVLEHHGDVAVFGRDVVHHAPADGDGAGRDLLQARYHAQRGRLAAT